MNRFTSLFLVCTVFLFITSCCQFITGNRADDYYFLDKSKIESFLKHKSDTAIFENATGVKSVYNKIEFFDDLVNEDDCVECCDAFEVRKLTYDSNLGGFKIKFEINRDEISEYFSVKYITKNALGIYYFGEDYFLVDNLDLTKIINKSEESISFYDTLVLNSQQFSNVYKFTKTISSNKLYVTEVYYSTALGMVGYKVSDGTLWSLVY